MFKTFLKCMTSLYPDMSANKSSASPLAFPTRMHGSREPYLRLHEANDLPDVVTGRRADVRGAHHVERLLGGGGVAGLPAPQNGARLGQQAGVHAPRPAGRHGCRDGRPLRRTRACHRSPRGRPPRHASSVPPSSQQLSWPPGAGAPRAPPCSACCQPAAGAGMVLGEVGGRGGGKSGGSKAAGPARSAGATGGGALPIQEGSEAAESGQGPCGTPVAFRSLCDIHRSFICLLPRSIYYPEDNAHYWEHSSNQPDWLEQM